MVRVRQLAAIMFADIVGYTALMEKDESLALRLRHKLQQKLETETRLHFGKILDFKDDGALCTFNSSIEGIKAAQHEESLCSLNVDPKFDTLHHEM